MILKKEPCGSDLRVTFIQLNSKLTDTGWVNVTLGNNVAIYDAASVMQVRKIGNVVYMRGRVRNLATFSTHESFLTIPAGYRPTTVEATKQVSNGTFMYTLIVMPSGICKMSDGVNDMYGAYQFTVGSLFSINTSWVI